MENDIRRGMKCKRWPCKHLCAQMSDLILTTYFEKMSYFCWFSFFLTMYMRKNVKVLEKKNTLNNGLQVLLFVEAHGRIIIMHYQKCSDKKNNVCRFLIFFFTGFPHAKFLRVEYNQWVVKSLNKPKTLMLQNISVTSDLVVGECTQIKFRCQIISFGNRKAELQDVLD